MPKVRIYELAKQYKISSNALINILKEMKYEPKSHMSVATEEMIKAVTKKFAEGKKEAKKEMDQKKQIKAAVERKSKEQKATVKKHWGFFTIAGLLGVSFFNLLSVSSEEITFKKYSLILYSAKAL